MSSESAPLKFLFVSDNLSTGGAQRQIVSLAAGLKLRGYLVQLFCYARGDMLAEPLQKAGIQVHWHVKRSRYSPDVVLALRRLIQEEQYDLVISFQSTPNFYTIIAAQLIKARRVPVIVSERFCDLPQGVSLMERFVRHFYRFAAHVVANSHHQRMNFAHKYPHLQSRLSTIYNGYDLEVFIPPLSERHNDPLKILAIASVSPYKNGLCLVEALNIIGKQNGPLPRVTWIGQRVRAGDRLRYLKEMEQKLGEYGLEQHWQWLDQRSDVVAQLHEHDVLVHPSYGEGLPNVVCEAMACARPVIVSDILDHSRLVQNDESGYLFDCQEPSHLAEKIRMFMRLSPEERIRMGQCGRRFAESHLSLGRFVDDYERLFMRMLNR
jgi:GalNAc-alpha-(1->4)-GalNAc-alpha-(1->3)-diNAcBac-PP-undecaprenol alpha-1,4-N-acetyl-D-galactosaminyltransferase